jgi:predicted TIM-barrel fold metal-dependent hydrolase
MSASDPLIDAHNHLGRWLSPAGGWIAADLAGGDPGVEWAVPDVPALVELLDRCDVEAIVNLDGRWGDELEANLDRYDRAHPGRFHTFCQLDWSLARCRADFGERLAGDLERSVAAGARGLKVWKTLGLGWKDERGRYLVPDDERIAPIWERAASLGVPVLIHTADPPAFFDPLDDRNERREELREHPDWAYHGIGAPPFARLLEAFEALVAGHPRTTFIGAHVVWVENLAWVGRMLASHPNLHVDISARMAGLAKRPDAVRRLLSEHAEQVLFGSDAFPPDAGVYADWRRFLSALELPGHVLDAVCRENALRLLA